ncbi:hypothetical protein AN220_00670 [Streptomyces nanshensis]|nr:hypothetical protein AN220_00670 [Streptomyces nanshensis]
MEADLLEIFRLDILDLYRGRLSLRRVHVLVHRLLNMPGRSALSAVVNKAAEWETTEHLLAALVDELALSNYMFQLVNFKGTPALPEPINRPGGDDKKPGETRKPKKPAQEFASPEKVASVFTSLQF